MDYTFVVSLESRKDRRAHMITLLETLGITKYEFVDPVKVCSRYMYIKNAEASRKLTTDLILEIAQERNYDKIMILEDDIDLACDAEVFKDILLNVRAIPLESRWDMIFFEWCYETCNGHVPLSGSKYFEYANAPLCAAAILYNMKSKGVINNCTCNKFEREAFDVAYKKCFKRKELVALKTLFPVFRQELKKFNTDIQTGYGYYLLGEKPLCRRPLTSKQTYIAILLTLLAVIYYIFVIKPIL